MTDIKILKEKIRSGELNCELSSLYTRDKDKLSAAVERYIDALEQFEKLLKLKYADMMGQSEFHREDKIDSLKSLEAICSPKKVEYPLS